MTTHLISDLHLSPDCPALCTLFTETLEAWRGRIDALYILGDLFEYWVGDDDTAHGLDAVLDAMQAFAATTPLFVMHGNRDFLLGDGFAARTGAILLPDPTLITIGGQRYLLSHGDALCTDDTAYQQFRAMSRHPAWQQAMLARPLAERHAIARQARKESEAGKAEQGMTAISDVTGSAVEALLDAQGWPVLIHGHTHRPDCHTIERNGQQSRRWVIRDWHGSTGGYLAIDANGVSAHPLG